MSFKSAIITLLVSLFILSACVQQSQDKKKELSFYVGTYTQGESEGIYTYQLNADGTLLKIGLAARSENPSFLTKSEDEKYLLAVNENSDENGGGGTVSTFQIKPEGLKAIDIKSSGGDWPCFIATNNSNYVLAANYGSGNVALLKLQTDGTLEGPLDVLQHNGMGTHPRQDAPHAHSAWFNNEDEIISVDLGTNDLWFSKLDMSSNNMVPQSPEKLAMPAESGPRHLAFHPKNPWIYVLNELSSTVSMVKQNTSGQYEIVTTQSTIPEGFEGENLCADIHISGDGKFLYASNRGHNSIVVYEINKDDGSLNLIGHENVRGDWPRNFTLSPNGNYLLVANERSNNIVSFKRSIQTGKLAFVAETEAPSPVCLLF